MTTYAMPLSPAAPPAHVNAERQQLADAIESLRTAEAELTSLVLAEHRAAGMLDTARAALATAESAIAAAAADRITETLRALCSPDGDPERAHPASDRARASHAAATEAEAAALAVRAAVAGEITQLRTFTVPALEGTVAAAIQEVAAGTEVRFEALAKSQRESWSTIRDRITSFKRHLRNDPNAVAPL